MRFSMIRRHSFVSPSHYTERSTKKDEVVKGVIRIHTHTLSLSDKHAIVEGTCIPFNKEHFVPRFFLVRHSTLKYLKADSSEEQRSMLGGLCGEEFNICSIRFNKC